MSLDASPSISQLFLEKQNRLQEIDSEIKKYTQYKDTAKKIAKTALITIAFLALALATIYITPFILMAMCLLPPMIFVFDSMIKDIWSSAINELWLSSGLISAAIGIAAVAGGSLIVAGGAGIAINYYKSRISKLNLERIAIS